MLKILGDQKSNRLKNIFVFVPLKNYAFRPAPGGIVVYFFMEYR